MSNLRAIGIPLLLLYGTCINGCADTGEAGAAASGAPESLLMMPPSAEDIAIQAVAGETGLDAADFVVVSSTAENFRDASLGCPQPGMAYAQVITPGYRVLLEAGGEIFDVRVAGSRGRICSSQADTAGKPKADSG
jgi:hypothetical protein